jgi:hypothetical protein
VRLTESHPRSCGRVLHGLAARGYGFPGLTTGAFLGEAPSGLNTVALRAADFSGRNEARREVCGLKAWDWVLVDRSGGRGGNGLRVAGSGFRVGGKWLWGLGLRGLAEVCEWR